MMGVLRAIGHEIVGLFVDNGALALALILWCVVAGCVALFFAGAWPGVIFAAGCAAILLANVVVAARARR